MRIEELLEKPYWIMDIFPRQVQASEGGQYFKIEHYYLRRMPLLCRKYVNWLLKLNCYFDIEVSHDGENWQSNPEPEDMEQWVESCMSEAPSVSSLFVLLKKGQVLLMVERDSTYMTIYNPTEDMLELMGQLAASEGLFVWKP